MKEQYPPSHSPTLLTEGSLALGYAGDTVGGRSPEKRDSALAILHEDQCIMYRSVRSPTSCLAH